MTLQTMYDEDDPEDTQFSIYTPSGTMKFYVNNPKVVPAMIEGRTFYVDLTPVEEQGV